MFNWISFLTYAVVATITPGPNNITAMSNGARLGFRLGLPFSLGLFVGQIAMVSLSTVFCNYLNTLIPVIARPMLFVGAAYILFLAYKTYTSSDQIDETKAKNGAITGVTMQFVNPKAYVYALVTVQAYILPSFSGNIPMIAFLIILLACISFISNTLWLVFGSVFKKLFASHGKLINTIMALLLVYCAVSLLLIEKI